MVHIQCFPVFQCCSEFHKRNMVVVSEKRNQKVLGLKKRKKKSVAFCVCSNWIGHSITIKVKTLEIHIIYQMGFISSWIIKVFTLRVPQMIMKQ